MTELEFLAPSTFWRRHALTLTAGSVALGVAAALVLAGTSGSDTGGNPTLGRASVQRDGEGPAPTSPEELGSTPANGFGSGAGITGGTAAGPGTEAFGKNVSQQLGDGAQSRIVRNGMVSLVVDDGQVGATVARVQALAAGVQGQVADSRSDELGESPSATLTLRVPVAQFDKVLSQVRSLGVKVANASTSGRDITAAYADTKAQIGSLQAARSRYLAILAGAKTIAETLTVQQRVDDVQGQIDRLEGQRRVLADSSDLATLTVTVVEEGDELSLNREANDGWGKAWDDAVDGFTGGLQSILAASGTVLLVLLVAAALYPAIVFGLRWGRRRYLNTAT